MKAIKSKFSKKSVEQLFSGEVGPVNHLVLGQHYIFLLIVVLLSDNVEIAITYCKICNTYVVGIEQDFKQYYMRVQCWRCYVNVSLEGELKVV